MFCPSLEFYTLWFFAVLNSRWMLWCVNFVCNKSPTAILCNCVWTLTPLQIPRPTPLALYHDNSKLFAQQRMSFDTVRISNHDVTQGVSFVYKVHRLYISFQMLADVGSFLQLAWCGQQRAVWLTVSVCWWCVGVCGCVRAVWLTVSVCWWCVGVCWCVRAEEGIVTDGKCVLVCARGFVQATECSVIDGKCLLVCSGVCGQLNVVWSTVCVSVCGCCGQQRQCDWR
jgi:hypothetical protein